MALSSLVNVFIATISHCKGFAKYREMKLKLGPENEEIPRNSEYISCSWSHSKYIHIFWVTLDVLLIYTFPVHTVQ